MAVFVLTVYSSMPRKMVAEMAAVGGAMKNLYIEIILYKKLLFMIRFNEMNLRFTMAHFICAEW